MSKHKINAPFLSKFNRPFQYFSGHSELCKSIIDEIGNILSTKLKLPGDYRSNVFMDVPFSYGVRDIQSVGISLEDLESFKEHCRLQILAFESRISDLEIEDISFNKEKQNIKMTINCKLKNSEQRFTTNIGIL
ncbi:MAG: hypothetical protein LBT03_00455 [Holosporales bacterium]|jgi:predicted component of type VI protein secretion system|nr:hypothetical protein [Holosporales bacterium]